jgi:hypothetical protein
VRRRDASTSFSGLLLEGAAPPAPQNAALAAVVVSGRCRRCCQPSR